MNLSTIIYEKQHGVAWIKLNAPQKMNALEDQMFKDLAVAVKKAAADKDIKVVVFTGSGKAFCAGGDIAKLNEGFSPNDGVKYVQDVHEIILDIINMDKPTIAAVNGYAVGAGFCFAILCDIIYASDNAKFSMAFRNVGLIPDMAGLYYLPRLVGLSKAKELTYTGRIIGPEEAEKIGIVSKVFKNEEFTEAVTVIAENIAIGPSFAFKEAKKILDMSQQITLNEVLNFEAYAQGLCFQSDYAKEAFKAFVEKRPFVFTDK